VIGSQAPEPCAEPGAECSSRTGPVAVPQMGVRSGTRRSPTVKASG
jgi:hypothetical protein